MWSFLELGALPSAVPCARIHARQVVWEWGLGALTEAVELVVSELVTSGAACVIRYHGQPLQGRLEAGCPAGSLVALLGPAERPDPGLGRQ